MAATAPADVEFAPVQTPVAEQPPVAVLTSDEGLSAGELGLIGGALAIGGLAAAAMLAGRRRRDPDAAPEDYVAATFIPRQPEADPAVAMPMAHPRTAAQGGVPIAAADTAATVTPFKPLYSAQPAQPAVAGSADRHVRLAEQGPTADNPFLTRKNRMRRARFLDAQDAKGLGSTLSGNWLDDRNARFRTAAAR